MAPPKTADAERPPWALDGSTGTLAMFRSNFPNHAMKAEPSTYTLLLEGTVVLKGEKTGVLNTAHAFLISRRAIPPRTLEEVFADPFQGLTNAQEKCRA